MIKFKNNLILAPLAGYTDCAFRKICQDCGAGLTVTEMVSAKGLHYENENTEILLKRNEDSPTHVQIFGNDPDIMAEACQNEKLQNFEGIDINMGCPVPKVVKNGEGSALLNDIKLAEKIISACAKATNKPVSVKFRIGFKNNEDICVEFAKMCEGAGAQFITIHGRTREDYYTGKAKYESIMQAANSIKIPVFANGDIKTKADYDSIINNSNVFGVAIGRGALGNPNIFNEIQNQKPINKITLIQKHLEYLQNNFSEHYALTSFKKHLCFYIENTQNAKQTRNLIFSSNNINDIQNYAIQALKYQI